MSMPPLPKLPQPGQEGPKPPTLPDVPLPSGLESLAGLFLLAQAMPQMVPQATQQLQTQRSAKSERDVAQFQLEQAAADRAAAEKQKAFENAMAQAKAQLEEIQIEDQRARDAADKEFRQAQLDLQKRAQTLAENTANMETKRFDATAANLLGQFYQDALANVERNYLTPAQRQQILKEPQYALQYQRLMAKDPAEAQRWLNSISGEQLTQTEKIRRANELMKANPGVQALLSATGKKLEDYIDPSMLPQALPVEGPVADALRTISSLTLKMMRPGAHSQEDLRAFSNAMIELGGTEALNKLSDDIARTAEVLYGTDRDFFEQTMAELANESASLERISLATPSPPPGEQRSGFLGQVGTQLEKLGTAFGITTNKEDEIKDLKRKIKAFGYSKKKKDEFRKRLAELEGTQPEAPKVPAPRGDMGMR